MRDLPEIDVLLTDPDTIDETLATHSSICGPHLLLVDDADMIEQPTVLADLARSRRADLHLIAVGRCDLKRNYSHWATALTRSRKGVWLQPSPGVDGDLWSTPMPRHIPTGIPQGRGFLVSDGIVELIQAARP